MTLFIPSVPPGHQCNQKAAKLDVNAILQLCKLVQPLYGGQGDVHLAESAAHASPSKIFRPIATALALALYNV